MSCWELAKGPTTMPERTILFLGADAEYAFKFRKGLMEAFRDRHYRVVVAATPLGDFDTGRFASLGVEFIPWRIGKASLDPVKDLGALFALYRILSSIQPDILFVHTIKPVIYGGILGYARRVPRRVAMIPGLGHAFMPPKGLRHRIAAIVAHLGYRAALGPMAVSIFHNPDDIADMRRAGALPPGARTARVHGSGVDMTHFRRAPLPSGPCTFLFVGRLLREKGIHEFVEAARNVRKHLPTARFIVVGGRDTNPSALTDAELDHWRGEGIVEFRGSISDPRDAFAECHIFVLPSFREGTPRTNLEAMATGRAIITTDVPGCRQTVRDGVNGILVPPADPIALAQAMIRLGTDPALVMRMGDAGYDLCRERFELGKVTAETMALIAGDPTGAPADRTH